MKAIWKFNVPIQDMFDLWLPDGAEIVTFQVQGEFAYIWAICDTSNESSKARHFRLYGTGHPHEDIKGKHIGTIQMNREFVWHLFEEEE